MFDSIDEYSTNFNDFEQHMQQLKEPKSEFIETFNPSSPQKQQSSDEMMNELCDFLDNRTFNRKVLADEALK